MDRCKISFENLVSYLDGAATPAEVQRIDVHLAGGCSSCQAQLATLRRSMEALRGELASSDQAPSDHSRAFARNLSRLRHPNTPATDPGTHLGLPIPAITRFVARLVEQPALASAGSRLLSASTSVQRLYETTDHLATLWEERLSGERACYIIGQIYSWEDNVYLIPDSVLFTELSSGASQWAVLEESEFHVPHLLPGSYTVQCWLNETDVLTLPNVSIGEA